MNDYPYPDEAQNDWPQVDVRKMIELHEQKENNMKRLENKVSISGTGIKNLTAKLIKRVDNKACYLRSDGVYEVFRIGTAPEEVVFGANYPEREVYPSNEDFGKTAWTYKTEDAAFNKLNNI